MNKVLSIILAVVFFIPSAVEAQNARLLQGSLSTEDLLAVGYVDLQAIDAQACLKWVKDQQLAPDQRVDELKPMAILAGEFLDQITKAGAEHALVLVRQEDLRFDGRPLFAVSVAPDQQPQKVLDTLKITLGMMRAEDIEIEVHNNLILCGTAKQIASAKLKPTVQRARLAAAWEKFTGHDAGVILVGNSDTRRVIKELWPPLDAPFAAMTGELVAEKVVSCGLTVELPNDLQAKLVVQTSEASAAKQICEALVQLKENLLGSKSEFSAMVPPVVGKAATSIKPVVLGTDVVADFAPVLNDRVLLADIFEPFAAGSRRTQRMNNMRQIVLATLNYESAKGSLPARANFTEDGKPLLSWRVHILPYIEENELYERFKLDEPWDSPHNIKLLPLMPDVYVDPSFKQARNNQAGKTRFVAPHGEGCLMSGQKGTTFRQMADGSSNTIAVVAVVPEAAVAWTKPSDWSVNWEHPKQGLFNDKHRETIFARADGSADVLNSDISARTLKALLTIAGGEVVP